MSGGPKPDFAALGPLYEDAFVNYPSNPVKALPAEAPGLGGSITAIAPGLYPPPTPLDDNPAWKEVNRQLNANFQFNIVANPGDYQVKIATTMAGNDLPDLIYFQGALDGVSRVPDFLKSRCADLGPYLSGDAAKDYPYLAAIPDLRLAERGHDRQRHVADGAAPALRAEYLVVQERDDLRRRDRRRLRAEECRGSQARDAGGQSATRRALRDLGLHELRHRPTAADCLSHQLVLRRCSTRRTTGGSSRRAS